MLQNDSSIYYIYIYMCVFLHLFWLNEPNTTSFSLCLQERDTLLEVMNHLHHLGVGVLLMITCGVGQRRQREEEEAHARHEKN